MLNLFWQDSSDLKAWLPRIQCHRGYCQTGLPENTLQSIQKAVQLGFKMVEFDVRLTADSQVILFHDDTILIRGHSTAISELTLRSLKEIVNVNELEQIFAWLMKLKSPEIKLNIEIKSSEIFNSILEKKVVELIHRYQLQSQIIISSFNPLSLSRIRFLDSSIYRALLLTLEKSPKNRWYLKKMVFNFLCRPHALHLFYQDWCENEAKWEKIKVPVVLWTYNDQTLKLNLKKVHGIITDQILPQDFNFE